MATTKIWPVKDRLSRVLAYGMNPEKTTGDLSAALGYAARADKTERCLYVAGVNCCPETALEEMRLTKHKWGKEEKGRAVAFHAIQSFAPGEVTPDAAHAIGREFARRMWGARFEVLVCTHLDKSHLHNHFIVNAVSFKDGGRYHDNKQSYYGKMRALSDTLCREKGLSVIEQPQGGGRHYAEWKAAQQGKPTLRGILRADIDAAIREAYSFATFVERLQQKGHRVHLDENHKYITVTPRGGQRAFRLTQRSMGPGYSEADIKERLARQRDGLPEIPRENAGKEPPPKAKPRRRYADAAAFTPRKHRKMKGFIALYWHYCYFLKVVKHGGKSQRLPFALRQEALRLGQYSRRFLFLYRHGITNAEELQAYRQGLDGQIDTLTRQRQPLYAERRACADEKEKTTLSESIAEKTAALRTLRRERRLCCQIAEETPALEEQVRQAEAALQAPAREQKEKEPRGMHQERFVL